jgi:hypothetical protein
VGHHHDREHRTKPPKIRRMHEADLVAIMSAILMTAPSAPKDAVSAVEAARKLLKQVRDSKPTGDSANES